MKARSSLTMRQLRSRCLAALAHCRGTLPEGQSPAGTAPAGPQPHPQPRGPILHACLPSPCRPAPASPAPAPPRPTLRRRQQPTSHAAVAAGWPARRRGGRLRRPCRAPSLPERRPHTGPVQAAAACPRHPASCKVGWGGYGCGVGCMIPYGDDAEMSSLAAGLSCWPGRVCAHAEPREAATAA